MKLNWRDPFGKKRMRLESEYQILKDMFDQQTDYVGYDEPRTEYGWDKAIDTVLEIIDDADKKAGDKTYIILDDGRFYSQTKYIRDRVLALKGGEQG